MAKNGVDAEACEFVMFGGCTTVFECESRLVAYLGMQTPKPSLLYEVPLAQPDVALMERLMEDLVKNEPRDWSWLLVNQTPVFAALFLVWRGIVGYRDGTYWLAVREITGVDSRPDETKLGEAFHRVLRDYGLAEYMDPEGLRYVAPILLHAGIPDSCLPEFFREVVWRRFVSREVVTPDDVRLELQRLRDERRCALESAERQWLDELADKKRKLVVQQRLIEQYRRLRGEWERIQEKRRDLETLLDRLLDSKRRTEQLESTRRAWQRELRRAQEVLEKLRRDKVRQLIDSENALLDIQAKLQPVEAVLQSLEEEHSRLRKRVAGLQERLGGSDWERTFYARLISPDRPQTSWRWLRLIGLAFEMAAEITGGPSPAGAGGWPEEIRRLLRDRAELVQRWNRTADDLCALSRAIRRHCPVPLVGQVAVLRNGKDEFLGVANVRVLFADVREAVRRWRELINEACAWRSKWEAVEAKKVEISQHLSALDTEIKRWHLEFADLIGKVQAFLELDPDLDPHDAQGIVSKLRVREDALRRELFLAADRLIELRGRRVDPEKLAEEERAIQGELNTLHQNIRTLESQVPMPPLSYVDKPVQRFLDYGGRATAEFLQHAVTLLMLTAAGGELEKPPWWLSTYRYERVWQAFGRWWREEGRLLCTTAWRLPRPRVACWREHEKWMVGVETPADLWIRPDLTVVHNGRELHVRPQPEGCWPLIDLAGTVEVLGAQGVLAIVDLETYWQQGQPCLVFRGWDDQEGPLPVLRQVSPGPLLAVVPQDWIPDGVDTGSAVLPEPVALAGYQAYRLEAGDRVGEIAFQRPGGERFVLKAGSPSFSLVGQPGWLDDGLDDLGPLFGEPPRLVPASLAAWEQVGTVKCSSRGTRGRTEFTVDVHERSPEGQVSVPVDSASDYYWVVIHDRGRYEKERLPFRYLPGIETVRTFAAQTPVFPPRSGHGETTLEIVGAGPYCVEWEHEKAGGLAPRGVTTPRGLLYRFPPAPQFDRLILRLAAGGGRPVPIQVVFERVWWAVGSGEEDLAQVSWTDRPLRLLRDWFRPTSAKVVWLRWAGGGPRLGAVRQVHVGHEKANRRAYPVRKDKTHCLVTIPLYEFSTFYESLDRVYLRLWVEETGACEIGILPIGEKPKSPDELTWRYLWEVSDLSVRAVCALEKRTRHWLVQWTEKGRATGRQLEMRKAWTPWEAPLERPLPDDASRVLLAADGETKLPGGPYLMRFRSAESTRRPPRVAPPSTVDTAVNSFFIFLDDGRPGVDDLSWSGEKMPATISGRTRHCSAGTAVWVVLLGTTPGGGGIVFCQGGGKIDSDGNFRVPLSGQCWGRGGAPEADCPPGAGVHHWRWLAVFVATDPVAYRGLLLKEPAPLECPWPGGATIRKAVWMSVFSRVQIPSSGLRLKIRSSDRAVQDTVLDEAVSRLIWKRWLQGEDEVEVKITYGYEMKHLKFTGLQDATVKAELEKGVVCTDPGCPRRGQFLPSQRVWDREHYPYCKQYSLLFRPFAADLRLVWDVRPLLAAGGKRFSWARECYRVLFDSQSNPLPIAMFPPDGGFPPVAALVTEFLFRELAMAAALDIGVPAGR